MQRCFCNHYLVPEQEDDYGQSLVACKHDVKTTTKNTLLHCEKQNVQKIGGRGGGDSEKKRVLYTKEEIPLRLKEERANRLTRNESRTDYHEKKSV